MGWKFTILLGGPDPLVPQGGNIITILHTGQMKEGLDFAEVYPKFDSEVVDVFSEFLGHACAVTAKVLSTEDKGPDEHEGNQTSDEPDGNNNTDLGEGSDETVGSVDNSDTDADVSNANTNDSDSKLDVDNDANGVTDIDTGTTASLSNAAIFTIHLVAQPMYASDSAGLHLFADHVLGMFPDDNFLTELNTWNQLFEAPSLPQCLDFSNPSLLSNAMMQPFMSMDFSDIYSASSFNLDLNQFGAFGALDLSRDSSASQAINNKPLSPIHSSSSTSLSGLPPDLDTQPPCRLLPTLPALIDHNHHDDSLLGHSKQKSIWSQRAERDNAIGKENSRQKSKVDKCSVEGNPTVKGESRSK
ncbi:hypothetical protein JVU11DRAFT_8121 [Chiua virens]|nr:hypothetical protein JVU11DRAFT_8121 [Chiua virens]